MLSPAFLEMYRSRGDNFGSLLARSTYLGKYSRAQETWSDTVRRIVEGSIALDTVSSKSSLSVEAEKLYHLIWTGRGFPPGRGLYTGGVPNMPVESLYNCWGTTIRTISDFAFAANVLLCGGGVGVALQYIDELPPVEQGDHPRIGILCSHSHANRDECMPDEIVPATTTILVADSRGGWVDALTDVLHAAFSGQSIVFNVSSIRKRGSPIRTFGGIAPGPQPLVNLLRSVWSVVRRAAGRKLTSIDVLDIVNYIGLCIASGGIRRSAILQLGNANDLEFRNAKNGDGAVLSHRCSSNNSILFDTQHQIDTFDWHALIEDNATYGEPGGLNLVKCRKDDPHVVVCNPCGEINLHDKEACCLAEVYPALITGDKEEAFKLITRYTLRQRLQPMVDPTADYVRRTNMRLGVGIGGLCDFAWSEGQLQQYYGYVRKAATDYANELGVSVPNKVTTVKPSGTISLMNGSSPGIHAPFAPYYIRRTRIGTSEPMAQALMDAGVPHEMCAYDPTGHTAVFSFPMAARNTAVTVQTESVEDQVERLVAVQRSYADNAVSCTISFAEHEKYKLAELLKKHINDIKSFSCLPKKSGYTQMPYEAIGAEEYWRRHSVINHDAQLTRGGELSDEGCEATGSCPIR